MKVNMEIKNVQKETGRTLNQFIKILSQFNQEQINIVPFEGGWTAGQVAKHIILADGGFADALNGPVGNTARRADEMHETIKGIFLNFDLKLSSPDFVLPPPGKYKKDELTNDLDKIKASLDKSIETLDMTKTCLAFELPVFGFLTRLEGVYFIIYHTRRHIRQLESIYKKVG
jgi:hypothetical protein